MWIRLAFLGGAFVVAFAAAWLVRLPHVPTCLFLFVTGHPCPGCGMTRSVVSLAHGDLVESLRMHPLGIALVGAAVASIAGTLVGLRRGEDPVMRFLDRRGPALVVTLIVAFVVVWLVRGFLVPQWSPDPVRTPFSFAAPAPR
jgi:hypothetical protein